MGGVKCSTAEPGEVFEHVEWSRLVLKLPGIERESLVGDGGSGPIDVLIQSWSDTLTGYSLSVQRLHLLQIAEAETSLEIIVAVEAYFAEASNSRLEKSLTDAVHEVVGAAESKLNELLDELGGSAAGDAEAKNENEKLADLVTTSSFRQALARQFERVNLLDGALSSCLLDVSIADPPFRSTRAVPCPVGSDAAAGAASCVECSWFTYACQGFWEDVSIAACAGILLMRKIYKKLRRVWVGDREVQERIESEALLAAVRAHGRTFDGVQYAPMGAISADTIVPTTDT
ncbi:hypothetical protein PHYBOEH_005001 [Phytophthora boehmeriae]|uniref:Uncharacterized protein n=1 Tax=Phytophthora boehmeriae TaxID=109152 RepID=A0A8T1WRQ0_9STRA|nr:hypothetical protein PHYBOEH_005001 [Phytophthora boehmeriae]